MSHTKPRNSRRKFLKSSATFGALSILPAHWVLGKQSASGALPPSEKVNLAIIGIGNRGNKNREIFLNSGLCNVVALCDVDLVGAHTHRARYSHGLTSKPPERAEGEELPPVYPKARAFNDFRKMFDEMADGIDAVLISTPDHSHFTATMLAMSLGKHVYVEKPLAHTFGQCERLIDLAARSGVVTQMGNQGHSGANYFQFKAWSEAGVIKDVTRISAYMNNPRRWHGWGAGVTEYFNEPTPEGVRWDLWANSAPVHAFSKRLHPQEWRSWFDYGSGAFGDWGPHILDTSHRFLKLGLPERVTAVRRDGANALVFPQASTIRFDFPAREGMPACQVTWYDGVENLPEIDPELGSLVKDEVSGASTREPFKITRPGKILYGKDLVFQGDSHARPLQVLPSEKFREMRQMLPEYSKRNSNHWANFLLACKGEEEARSPFSVSGPLCQVFNLGVIAQRLGGTIAFDRETKRITNHVGAQALLDPAPRAEWAEFYHL
jgi:predicted dehydrogenase